MLQVKVNDPKQVKNLIKTAIIAVVVLILFPTCVVRCTRVDSSEIGIKFSKLSLNEQGGLDATTCSGFTFYNPITTDIYTYETRVRQVNYDPFVVQTKDGSKFTMDPNLSYQLKRDCAVSVFAKYRKSLENIESNYMRTAIYDAYRINANRYTADELIANRAKFEDDVNAMLSVSLDKEGFHIEQFTSQIEPPASLTDMINAKNAAVQAALKAENEVKKAEADAKIAVAQAEGVAKAMRVKADAEAYYNMKISASLTDRIVQEDWIEKWDGKLPSVQGGNSMMPIVNLPN